MTHMHGDHIGGIEQLLWERYYTSATGGPGWLKTAIFTTGVIHNALRRALHDCVDEYTSDTGYPAYGGYDALVETCILPGDGTGASS